MDCRTAVSPASSPSQSTDRASHTTCEAKWAESSVRRRRWQIRGQVQGVGFRPAVYRLARRWRLTGYVQNDDQGVTIEAQGEVENLVTFGEALVREGPPLARIHSIHCIEILTQEGETEFAIRTSPDDSIDLQAAVAVDTAVCDDCIGELFSSNDRRAGYALINCTNCGPRYTILRRVPYDRQNTTMAGFRLCPACAAEYADPNNRRFHAQPTACPDCGPRLQLVTSHGAPLSGDPIIEAAHLLLAGQIVAIKGLGGFHLAVRADLEESVRRLRDLKQRDAKPFAVLVASLARAEQLVRLSSAARQLLLSPSRPIVLSPRRFERQIAKSVAPNCHRLGVMLPYTPMHHLLFAQLSGLDTLVMTSGNLSDEPLAISNDEAVRRLNGMCDAILWHERPIHRCVDDSVVIDCADDPPLFVRRARGFAPQSLFLSHGSDHSAGLCVGGELKNTVAVVRGTEVILSQHVGDLKHPSAYQHFERTCEDLRQLLGVTPNWIATDLHPQYLSSQYAERMATVWQIPVLKVQHHHAHAAAVMADNQHAGPVLAVICDGVGLGTDGEIWGGELLHADYTGFRRLASLKPLPLIGGDAAARDTRRCALAFLWQQTPIRASLGQHPIVREWWPSVADRRLLIEMLNRKVHCVPSSAAGRVFDAAAAALGLCQFNEFEAQAGQRLESSAYRSGLARVNLLDVSAVDCMPKFALSPDELEPQLTRIDFTPVVCHLVDQRVCGDVGQLAYWFHEQFAMAWEAVVAVAAARTGIRDVALSGGVFCNELLTKLLTKRLQQRGLRVLRHVQVSPNDSGLALGQAAVACACQEAETRPIFGLHIDPGCSHRSH